MAVDALNMAKSRTCCMRVCVCIVCMLVLSRKQSFNSACVILYFSTAAAAAAGAQGLSRSVTRLQRGRGWIVATYAGVEYASLP
eukprot:2118348-Amphidinium_carterae.1